MTVAGTVTLEMLLAEQQTKLLADGSDGLGYSVAVDGDYAVVGAYSPVTVDGTVSVYVRSSGSWTIQDTLTASDSGFGMCVDISGTTIIAGAQYEGGAGDNRGAAYVFTRSGTVWTQEAKLTPASPADFDYFGGAVAISKDAVAIGAVGYDGAGTDRGAVYPFTRSGTVWTEETLLVSSDPTDDAKFGFSVDIQQIPTSNGEAVIVGAPGKDSNKGAAYTFESYGGLWAQLNKITDTSGVAGDYFGYSVAAYGEVYTDMTYAVGALRSAGISPSRTGNINVYSRTGTDPINVLTLFGENASGIDYVGHSVSITENYIVAGNYYKFLDGGALAGCAYVFVKNGDSWVRAMVLKSSDLAAGDYFGYSVAVDDTTVIVGAIGDESGVGAAYTFSLWRDVTEDMRYPVSCSYGMMSGKPVDRVASTGVLEIDLDNSANNTAGLVGYYSPGHSNAALGFDAGTIVVLTITDGENTKKFRGRIANNGIKPVAGTYRKRMTSITVVDYMDAMAAFPLKIVELQTDKTIVEVVQDIVDKMPIKPVSTDYTSSSVSTFSYVYDTLSDNSRALTEALKLALSEYGFVYVKRDATYGEVLTVEGKHDRINKTSEHTFADDMQYIEVERGAYYSNRIQVTAHPRQIDAAATTVLSALQTPIYLFGGETRTNVLFKYRDPTGGSRQVSGMDMVTPVSGTDYAMFANEDGSGTDLTANLTVTASYGADGVSYTLYNSGSDGGYVTLLKARGKGIYQFDPVTSDKANTGEINARGEVSLKINQAYQDNPNAANSIASYLSGRLSTPRNDIISLDFIANESASFMTAFLTLDIGSRFTVTEAVTGISTADYFVNGISFSILAGGIIKVVWTPSEIADATIYWRLAEDSATDTYSQLGVDTVLAF